MTYVELRAKSNFSFLLGASYPEELVEQAVAQGLAGIAITDINGVYGMPKGFRKAKHHSQFKYIVGSEIKIQDHPNVTLLCRTRQAYGVMTTLLTRAHADKEKGEGILSFEEFQSFSSRSQDLICLPYDGENTKYRDLKSIFEDRLYLPLTRYMDGHDKKRTEQLVKLSKQLDARLVATNDVYYHVKERKLVQDVLISIKEGKPLDQVGFKLFSNSERYIKSPKQMRKLYADLPEALNVTHEIAESSTFSPSELRYIYPSKWIPEGFTAQSYLEHLVWERTKTRYEGELPPKVVMQLKHEMSLIKQLNFADYFLTIFEIVEFARGRKILCQGRGSAANSAVCYVLGITAIDPVQMNLLFERFISSERGEPPDIDVDFEHERREEVIQHIYEKYGRDRAAMISAVVTYQKRSAFREVAKAFGVPVGTLSAKKVMRDFDELTKDSKLPDLRERIDVIAEEMKGFPRHISIHSGGFTLSADPITEIVPVEPARMDGRTIIQWDKYDLDELGLLKVDVLALGMLSAIRKMLDLVGKQLHEIPHDDPATYAMIQRCDTVGTFQIESRAQMSMLGRLQPKNFYDLVIEVAIMRPGPIVGQIVHPFLKRRRGQEKVSFPDPRVEAILGRTMGVPLFQEQVMKLAIDLAGFTPGEADELRRSIAAWRSSASVQKMGERLMKGLIDSGMPEQFALQMFNQMQGFSHYGFPESHAASFALIAYASSYLKRHHHTEFTASLINSQPMGFYQNHTLVFDAQRHGVKVLPVSVNASDWDCTIIDTKTFRLGLRTISGLARRECDQILKVRPFDSFSDFLKRSTVRKDVLCRIAMAGGFDEFGIEPRNALWTILNYQNIKVLKNQEQLDMFHLSSYEVTTEGNFQQQSKFERIQEDYAAFNLSTHGHPMQALRQMHKKIPRNNSREIKQNKHGTIVKSGGLLIVRQKPPTAKGVTFLTMEDEAGFLDLVIHHEVYQKYSEAFLNHCFVIVKGRLQKDGHTTNILVQEVTPIWPQEHHEDTPLSIEPDQYFW